MFIIIFKYIILNGLIQVYYAMYYIINEIFSRVSNKKKKP